MARLTGIAALLAATALAAGCGGGDKVSGGPPAAEVPMNLGIASPAFGEGGTIPKRFTCAGAGARPALTFSGAPPQAVELALFVIDPDAGGGGFVHWTVYGMPRTTRGIPSRGLPAGAREGKTSSGGTGWTPPCPPSGTHRYEFELYWLRAPSKLAAGAAPQRVADVIRTRAGGRGELIGRFGRGQ